MLYLARFLNPRILAQICVLPEFALNFQAHFISPQQSKFTQKFLAFVHSREQLDIVLSFKHFGV